MTSSGSGTGSAHIAVISRAVPAWAVRAGAARTLASGDALASPVMPNGLARQLRHGLEQPIDVVGVVVGDDAGAQGAVGL